VAVNNANITGEGACSEGQLKSDSRENHNFWVWILNNY
jgi:hypothetical protein